MESCSKKQGIICPKAVPQHVSTLRGAACFLWMTQGAGCEGSALPGSGSPGAAEWDT